ncbi:ADP-ribosylation factor-like protein 6-interacting protein 6 isoform X1 [Chelonus insularis]|uniref:ADP-ribosylation factor-like protein 6-interacting protein 6 isoform X1 n=1 Tax=Chelonus insularis TaxID=460826 RepID=UPI00158C440A|nr:ADP-ribosylation factor-like protein 6-interacting protein 6 isoform X1 [Chelonus insularis]
MANFFQYDQCNDDIKVQENKKRSSALSKFEMNEWTFSVCLFLISSAIVLGKIYLLYGQPLIIKNNYIISKELYFSNFQDVFLLPNDVISHTRDVFQKNKWFFKALCSGLGVTAFTWFIIYKDSYIPGINPPSPFSPSKKKIRHCDESKVPLNYLMGIVNGVLIFIYMCL